MRLAYTQALKGYQEDGCPSGGVLVETATGEVLGAGHNSQWGKRCKIAEVGKK